MRLLLCATLACSAVDNQITTFLSPPAPPTGPHETRCIDRAISTCSLVPRPLSERGLGTRLFNLNSASLTNAVAASDGSYTRLVRAG